MRTEVDTYLRLEQIIGTDRAKPRQKITPDSPPEKTRKTESLHYDGILAISRTAFFTGVRTGKYPAPIKLGHRTAVWAASTLIAAIEALRYSAPLHTPQPAATAKTQPGPAGDTTVPPRRGPGRPSKQAA